MKYVCKLQLVSKLSFFFFLFSGFLSAQCTLACLSEVTAAYGDDGLVLWGQDFLEFSDCESPLVWEVIDSNNQILFSGYGLDESYSFSSDAIGQTFTYAITSPDDNRCWGQLTIVDKSVDPSEGSGDCTLVCAEEVDLPINASEASHPILLQAIAGSVCDADISLTFTDLDTGETFQSGSFSGASLVARSDVGDQYSYSVQTADGSISCNGLITIVEADPTFGDDNDDGETENCALVCISGLVVSYIEGADLILFGSDFLEGTPCEGEYEVEIVTHDHSLVVSASSLEEPMALDSSDVGLTHWYNVRHVESGNSCWGGVTIEAADPGGLPPVAICNDIVRVKLEDGTANVFAEAFDAGSHNFGTSELSFGVKKVDDLCGNPTEEFTPFVTFCSADIGVDIYVIMRVSDEQGLFNDCIIQVTVEGRNNNEDDDNDDNIDDEEGSEEPDCNGPLADFSQLDIPLELTYESISIKDLNIELEEMYSTAIDGIISESSLIGYSIEQTIIELGDGKMKILNQLTFIDWCHFNPTTEDGLYIIDQIIKIGSLSDFDAGMTVTNNMDESMMITNVQLLNSDGNQIAPKYNCDPNIGSAIACAIEEAGWTGSFSVEIDKEDLCTNGVTTLDLILIQKHILQLESFEENWKYLAGDINDDQKLTASDLVGIRNIILGTVDCIDDNKWKFAKKELLSANDFSLNQIADYDLQFQVANLSADDIEVLAVKVGDLNNTANLRGKERTSPRSVSHLRMVTPSRNNVDMISIPVFANDFDEISSMKLAIDISDMEWIGLESGQLAMDPDNVRLEENLVDILYYDVNTLDVRFDVPLFTIKLRGAKNDKDIEREIEILPQSYIYTDVDENTLAMLSSIFDHNTEVVKPFCPHVTVINTGSELVFDLDDSQDQISQIYLMSMTGQQLKQSSSLIVDVSDLNMSMVHYLVETVDGKIYTGKSVVY